MTNLTLSALVDEHMATLASGGYAANTRRMAARVERQFLAHVGNIQLRHVTARHVDTYFASRLSKLQASSLNAELVCLRQMFKFAIARGYLRADPCAHRRRLRVQPKSKQRIPAADFPRLLDACRHPRDRMLMALGIYLLLRQSEITALRVGHVSLVHGTVSTQILKTAKFDEMPVSAELDVELRRWLTWYAQQVGPLQDSMYLVPAKARPALRGAATITDADDTPLQPYRPMMQPERVVKKALAACGYSLTDAEGNSSREGVHTLRRSAARAMFDRLSGSGYDGAGRVVQALLHHSTFRQTEHYLGIELDTLRRDDVIRGKEMFPTAQDNVVQMRREQWQ